MTLKPDGYSRRKYYKSGDRIGEKWFASAGIKEHFMFYIVIIQSTGRPIVCTIASMANNCKNEENVKRTLLGSRIESHEY